MDTGKVVFAKIASCLMKELINGNVYFKEATMLGLADAICILIATWAAVKIIRALKE